MLTNLQRSQSGPTLETNLRLDLLIHCTYFGVLPAALPASVPDRRTATFRMPTGGRSVAWVDGALPGQVGR